MVLGANGYHQLPNIVQQDQDSYNSNAQTKNSQITLNQTVAVPDNGPNLPGPLGPPKILTPSDA